MFEEFLSGLPPYVAIVLLYAYLIWAKYLNNGKLKPDEKLYKDPVDAVIVIFVLATIYFLFIWFLSSILYIAATINMINRFDIRLFVFDSKYFGGIVILFAIGLIITLGANIGKKVTKADFRESHMEFIIEILTFAFFISFFGFFMSNFLAPFYSNSFEDMLVISFIIIVLILFIFLLISNSKFFEFVNMKSLLAKLTNRSSAIIFIIVPILILISLFLFCTPKFEITDKTEYYLIDNNLYFNDLAERHIARTAKFKGGGYILKLQSINLSEFDGIQNIEVKYLNITEDGKFEEVASVHESDKKVNLSFIGLKEYKLTNDNIILNVNRGKMKKRNVSIIIYGFKKENISRKFIVNHTPLEHIKENYYKQNLTFINKLDYEIRGSKISLVKGSSLFDKQCNLTNATGYIEGKNDKIIVDIMPDYRHIEIFFWNENFRIILQKPYSRLRYLNAYTFEIPNKTVVHLTFIYKCR